MITDVAGRTLYAAAGILLAVIFLGSKIEKAYEMNLAYKNPAKTIERQVKELTTTRTALRIQATKTAEIAKKLDIAIAGNAKVEKKPDGTLVITGNKIDLKSDTDKKTATTGSTDQTIDQVKKVDTKEKEKDTPILPKGGTWSVLAGPNWALNGAMAGGGIWLGDNLSIKEIYVLDLTAPKLDKKNLYTTLEVRF